MHVGSKPQRLHGSTLTIQARAAGLYVLVALLLLVALTLVALPAETSDDRWIRIGSLMAAAGLAVWLPPRALVPAALLVWMAPVLARELFDEGRSVGWTETAVLAGLILLALSVHYIYTTTLQLLSLHPRPPKRPSDAIRERLQSHVLAGRSSDQDLSSALDFRPHPQPTHESRGRWANAPKLSQADAAYFLRKLRALDAEVVSTAHMLRAPRSWARPHWID